MVGKASHINKDLLRANMFAKLIEAGSRNSEFGKVDFFLNPNCVRAAATIEAGALRLWPITDLSRISTSTEPNASKTTVTGSDGTKFALDSPKVLRQSKDATAQFLKDSLFAAFWQVSTSTNHEDANMEFEDKTVGRWTIPTMVNTCELQKFDKLVIYEPPKTNVADEPAKATVEATPANPRTAKAVSKAPPAKAPPTKKAKH